MTPKIVPSLGIPFPPLVHGLLVQPESIYTVLQTACRLVQLVCTGMAVTNTHTHEPYKNASHNFRFSSATFKVNQVQFLCVQLCSS